MLAAGEAKTGCGAVAAAALQRPRGHQRERAGRRNKWIGKKGDFLEFRDDKPFHLRGIRLVLDSDLNRDYQNMPCCIRLHEERFRLPKTLIKDLDIVLTLSDGKTKTLALRDVHTRFLRLFADEEVTSVRLSPLATNGAETYNIFSFEVF